jgi:DNA polymerase-3 subunit gamma/tau
MAQALYRKWRPQTFDEVSGQEHVLHTLRNAIASERIAHAYLFSGPRGTGKTTMARLLAKAVNCLNPDRSARPDNTCAICTAITEGRLLDLIELDAASNRGIDEIRDLRDKINFAPGQARFKVYIIDEVHMLTEPAFNALLKTLEEPPAHAIFVLATTDPQKVPATIVSRCQPFAFRRLTVSEIVTRLQELVVGEHLSAEPEALALIARQATGAMRDAESLLDQLAAGGEEITVARAQAALGAGALRWVSDVVNALCDADAAAGLDAINQAVDSGADARQFARQIVEHLRAVMLIKLGDPALVDLPAEQRANYNSQAERLELDRLTRAIRLFNQAALDLRGGWQPQLPLELALVEALQLPTAPVMSGAVSPAVRKPAASAAPAQTAAAKEPAPGSAKPQSAPKSKSPLPAAQDPPPAAPPEATALLTVEQVVAQWDVMLGSIKTRSIPTEALLRYCHVAAIEHSTVVLSWPNDSMKNRFEGSKHQRLLEDMLSSTFEQKLHVRSVVEDPMLQTALKLGAKVTPVNR